MKHAIRSTATLALAACSATAVAADSTQMPLLAPLADQQHVRGCAWLASASTLGPGFMFMAEYDESAAWMHVDGADLRLAVAEPDGGAMLRVGDVIERTYSAADVEVRARYEATWVCPADSEGCEVTRFAATYEVSKQNRIQIVEAVGEVGC